MPLPDPTLETNGTSSNSGAQVIVFDTTAADFPPKKRKIDPSTIWWPEGEAKPWEKHEPQQGPLPSDADNTAL